MKRKKNSGFTLLETMIALMILAGGILLLVNSWGSTAKRIKKMEMNHQIAALLDQKLAEFETEYQGQPIEAIPEEDGEEFSEYPGYAWKMESRELNFPDMSAALSAGGQKPDPTLITMVKALTEVLKNSVREVKFTIVVQSKKKTREFSATRYFVDFNKEIAIGL